MLTDVLAANTTYTLSGFVGHPIGYGATPPATTYTVELLAGANLLASSLPATGLEGSLSAFSLSFDSFGSAFVGQPLGIRLTSSQAQTAYDDIHLDAAANEAVPLPGVAMAGMVLLGGLGARRSLGRGRGALA